MLIIEKAQLWDDRERQEKVISFACQEVPEIAEDMVTKAKAQNLGKVIVDFKRDLEDLQAIMDPSTPLEKVDERKGAIEDVVT